MCKTLKAVVDLAILAIPTEDKGALEWIVGVKITRDRKARTLSMSQELYISDLLGRFSDALASGHSRKYTSPMDDRVRLSADLSPEAGSPEHEAMASRRHPEQVIWSMHFYRLMMQRKAAFMLWGCCLMKIW